eukprot:2347323-Alexandrium_andersonii.AAC.1
MGSSSISRKALFRVNASPLLRPTPSHVTRGSTKHSGSRWVAMCRCRFGGAESGVVVRLRAHKHPSQTSGLS